jgi:hypothetical protein
MVNGDFVSTVSPDGRVQSERALVVNDKADDARYWSDEWLAVYTAQALENAADMIWEVMRCAYEWQRRYGYGEHWAERLVEFIKRYTGERGCSVREVQYLAGEWPKYKDHKEEWRLHRGRISHLVASDENPEEAMSVATVALLEGQPRMAVVETLRERRGLEPREKCQCPECGNVHNRKD